MTERRRYLLITAALGLALVIVALLAVPGSPIQRKPILGLDLQGGFSVVLSGLIHAHLTMPFRRPAGAVTRSPPERRRKSCGIKSLGPGATVVW